MNQADDFEEFELNSLLGNEAVDNAEQVEDAIEPNHSKHHKHKKHKHHHGHEEQHDPEMLVVEFLESQAGYGSDKFLM